jgi:hypothetical protein
MKSVDDIISRCVALIEGNRSRSKAGIARDLAAQGATAEHIADSLQGFDEEFDAAVERALPAVREQIEGWLREPARRVH